MSRASRKGFINMHSTSKVMGSRADAARLFLLSLRAYSIPYVLLLSASGMLVTGAGVAENAGILVSGALFWMGGMLYYDLAHEEQDRISRPYRLLPRYPSMRRIVVLAAGSFLAAGAVLILVVEPIMAGVILLLSLAVAPLYNRFRSSVRSHLKYVVRGVGGAIYVVYPPLLLHSPSAELLLLALAALFLDAGGNVIGDIRDVAIDGDRSPVRVMGAERLRYMVLATGLAATLLASYVILLLSGPLLYLLLLAYGAGYLAAREIAEPLSTHQAYLSFKILFYSLVLAALSGSLEVGLIGILSLAPALLLYRASHGAGHGYLVLEE